MVLIFDGLGRERGRGEGERLLSCDLFNLLLASPEEKMARSLLFPFLSFVSDFRWAARAVGAGGRLMDTGLSLSLSLSLLPIPFAPHGAQVTMREGGDGR
jgi:hypothetical protein